MKREATEQLLASDAVDRSVASIDFRELAGKKVYFDTTYLKNVKGIGFVNADYIISSLRQQMVAARCLLQEKKADAEYVVEARVGALGTDGHEITYGIPSNSGLTSAASLLPTAPPLPVLPELSVAKKNDHRAAVKIGAFAYHRETGEPLWQAGIAQARSTAKDTWLMGAGPFQSGTIYSSTQFAGAKLGLPLLEHEEATAKVKVPYNDEYHFGRPGQDDVPGAPTTTGGAVVPASASQPAEKPPEKQTPAKDSQPDDKAAAPEKPAAQQPASPGEPKLLPVPGGADNPKPADKPKPADAKPDVKGQAATATSAEAIAGQTAAAGDSNLDESSDAAIARVNAMLESLQQR